MFRAYEVARKTRSYAVISRAFIGNIAYSYYDHAKAQESNLSIKDRRRRNILRGNGGYIYCPFPFRVEEKGYPCKAP
jgi:hypothetical protein